MAGVTVVLLGLDTSVAKIVDLAETAPEKIKTIMGEIATEAKAVMDGATPVRTGKLKAGNTLETTDNSFTLSNATENDEGTIYSGFVEFGTRYMAAQPFLAPAVEMIVKAIPERLPSALELS
jgi:HK97 gp10 family phage protein